MRVYVGVLLGIVGLVIIVAGVQSRGDELFYVVTGQAAPGQHVWKQKRIPDGQPA